MMGEKCEGDGGAAMMLLWILLLFAFVLNGCDGFNSWKGKGLGFTVDGRQHYLKLERIDR